MLTLSLPSFPPHFLPPHSGNVGPEGCKTVVRLKRHSYDHKRTWFSAVVEHWKGDRASRPRGEHANHYFRARLVLGSEAADMFCSTVSLKSLKWVGVSPRPNQSRVEGHIVIEKIVGDEAIPLYNAPVVLYQKRSLGERLNRSKYGTSKQARDCRDCVETDVYA